MISLDSNRLALVRPAEGAAGVDPAALVARMGRGGVHEIAEAAFGDAPAAARLALAALAASRPGPVLWVQEARARREHGALSARGAQAVGLDPGRLLLAAAPRPREALWAVEEGVRSAALAAVVAELSEASFTATRRLHLAAAERGVPAILLMPHTREGATAAQTRWRVAPAPAAPAAHDPQAPGPARLRATLERTRSAPAAAGRGFLLEFDDETHALRVVDRLADRPAAPRPRPPRPAAGRELRRTG